MIADMIIDMKREKVYSLIIYTVFENQDRGALLGVAIDSGSNRVEAIAEENQRRVYRKSAQSIYPFLI